MEKWKNIEVIDTKNVMIDELIGSCPDEHIKIYAFKKIVNGVNRILFTDDMISLGDNELYIDKANHKKMLKYFEENLDSEDFEKYLKDISKKIKAGKDANIYYNGKENKFSNYFYKTVTPANIDDLELGADEIEEIINIGMFEGFKIDEDIYNLSLLNNYIIDNDNRADVMTYSPHSVIVSGTKAGKTTTFRKMGVVSDSLNVTPARLLGYSTGDTVNRGELSDINKPFAFDEIEELKNTESQVTKGLLSLMERGETTIMKGKKSIKTRYLNSLTFLSNPEIMRKEEFKKGLSVYSLLKGISENFEALGSRLAILYYNPDSLKAKKVNNYDSSLINKAKSILITIRKYLSQVYLKLLNNDKVMTYLEDNTIDESYIEQMKNLYESVELEELEKFLESLTHYNYKHLKGASLRLALWQPDLISTLLKLDDPETIVDKILSTSKTCLKKLYTINLESITRVLKGGKGLNIFTAFLDTEVSNIPHDLNYYEQIITLSYILTISEKKQEQLYIDDLKSKFSRIADHLKEKDRYFSRIKKRAFQGNFDKKNILNKFGIKLEKIENKLYFFLDNEKTLFKYIDKIKKQLLRSLDIELPEKPDDKDKLYETIKEKEQFKATELYKQYDTDKVDDLIEKLTKQDKLYQVKGDLYIYEET